jgi:hypothetical protein
MDMAQTSAAGLRTIDLGDLSVPEVEATPDTASPAVLRTVRAALVVLLVLTAAGATTGEAHLVAPMWTRPASLAGFVVGATTVTISDPGAGAVIGLDPETGRIRWDLPLPVRPQYIYATGGGVVGVVVRDVNAADDETRVTLLVTESGTVLAGMPGNQVTVVPTTSLLLAETGQGSVTVGCPEGAEVCTDVAGFDLAAERQVWRRALPGFMVPSPASPEGPLTRFATVRANGLVEIRDPATGDQVGAVRLPASQLGLESAPRLLLFGDTLLSAVRHDGRAELLAVAVGPRGYNWSVGLAVSRTLGVQFFLAGCGRLVCLHVDGADLLFDPSTGTQRGQVANQVVGEVGQTLLAVPSFERPGTPQSRRTVYLLRATDGRETDMLPDTAVVRWGDTGGRVMLARQGSFGTTFTVIDGLGGSRLLGTVASADLICEAMRTFLVCADPMGVVRAWRLPVTST